jgi:erythronate-4-phosphate dehydrogenase
MKILADENIPLLDEFFADLGELTRTSGRSLSVQQVQNADVLLVRSVTKVNEVLVKNAKIKFVGTCTIGTDHVDQAYLQKQGVYFASAPGCNAQSVVDYVLSALCSFAESQSRSLLSLTVGIVGVGNVGFKLRQRLEALGLKVLAVDPFKCAQEVGPLVTLDEALQADVLCLHTPLTQSGSHPTEHLIGLTQLQRMRPNACLISAGRGAVVDNAALLAHLRSTPSFIAILDVWENEPTPDIELVHACFLATPHIAGYSLDGKMAGTQQIYQALCQYLGRPALKKLTDFLPEPAIKELRFSATVDTEQSLWSAVRAVYDVRGDTARMRMACVSEHGLAQRFDALRKDYPLRRDLHNTQVKGADLLFKAGFSLTRS